MARKSEHVTWRAELAAGFEPLLLELGAAALGTTPGDFTETFELCVANPPMLSNLGMQWLLATE